jgi:RNA polymerase sigma factor (sigma-70 family)
MTDQKFIDSIQTGGGVMQKAVEWFYRDNYGLVYKMVGAHKLDKEEGLDAYSDALTAFVENIRNDKFRGDSKCSTYFIRIFNNKCIDIIRKKTTNRVVRNTISLENMGSEPVQNDAEEDQNMDYSASFVELSGICREVLMDWSDGYTMEEIALRNGLRNAHTARSKRYNCFKQLMAILQRKSIVDENFNLKKDGEQF